MRRVRQEIKASKFPDLPLYFTEWSTSYTPRDLVHDSYISAPYILSKLKACQGLVEGMSYWTYSDLFEEPGPPPTPFHGGFGLLNREGLPKPAYFSYKYLHALEGNEIPVVDSNAFAAVEKDRVSAVIWELSATRAEGQQSTILQPHRSSHACAASPLQCPTSQIWRLPTGDSSHRLSRQ